MTKDAMDASGWTTIASQAAPSSYLDPLMGRQKAKVHQRFIRAGARDLKPQAVLKADVFEEAVGSDHILFDLWPAERLTVGMDIALEAAGGAVSRSPGMQVMATDWLIHNPRLISTLLFVSLRRLMGARAELPIRALRCFFCLCAHLPTQCVTTCFPAACAWRPELEEQPT
jgi:hypothetical protein